MEEKPQKVLVTGGAGFIGSHVVEELMKENFQVRVLDNLVTGKRGNLPPKVSIHCADLTEPEKIKEVFANEHPDIIIHLAAQTSVGNSIKNPYYDCQNNILATINLLDYCVKYKVKRIIFASTAAVYGHPDQLPIKEDTIQHPLSFYGQSKLTAEKYIQLYSHLYDLPFTILRFSNVYGKRQNTEGEAGVISIFLEHASRDQPVNIFGNGNQTRDFIYVKDVASAIITAITNGKNQIINISSNKRTSVNELVKSISDLSNQELKSIHKPSRHGDVLDSQLCNKKAKILLNWEPSYSLTEGLKEMLS